MVGSFSVDLTTTSDLGTSQISTSSQKRIKVRPALIADDDNDDGIEIVASKPTKMGKAKPAAPEIEKMGSREHLKTKKQIEDLRKEYGDGWLQCQSASKVQDVMGIQVPIKIATQKSTEQVLESMFHFGTPPNFSKLDQTLTSTPIQQSQHHDFAHSTPEVSKMIKFIEYLTINFLLFR